VDAECDAYGNAHADADCYRDSDINVYPVADSHAERDAHGHR
jgi:hypothetical protein